MVVITQKIKVKRGRGDVEKGKSRLKAARKSGNKAAVRIAKRSLMARERRLADSRRGTGKKLKNTVALHKPLKKLENKSGSASKSKMKSYYAKRKAFQKSGKKERSVLREELIHRRRPRRGGTRRRVIRTYNARTKKRGIKFESKDKYKTRAKRDQVRARDKRGGRGYGRGGRFGGSRGRPNVRTPRGRGGGRFNRSRGRPSNSGGGGRFNRSRGRSGRGGRNLSSGFRGRELTAMRGGLRGIRGKRGRSG